MCMQSHALAIVGDGLDDLLNALFKFSHSELISTTSSRFSHGTKITSLPPSIRLFNGFILIRAVWVPAQLDPDYIK
ncbi:hypothetical protein PM082_006828 [Marasmius tenuissimus]|nr:hypothetical protein PM082_006828 [Marasmius tenuissimus]